MKAFDDKSFSGVGYPDFIKTQLVNAPHRGTFLES